MTINTHSEAPAAAYLEFTLGDRLTRALRHADLGVSEMAEILGVGRETVSRWMNDRGTPKRAALLAWASITNVEVHWLEAGCAEKHSSEKDLRACRDSNPKPSDLYLAWSQPTVIGVNSRLTADRLAEVPPTRRLRSVQTARAS